MKTIAEIRRSRLNEWLATRSIPENEKSYFSQLLSGKASFGERAARRIEASYGMTERYLDNDTPVFDGPETERLATDETHVFVPQLDIKVCAGNGAVNDEHLQVDGELAFKRSWMHKRNLVAKNLRVLECKGASMTPYLADGDTMLVDITSTDARHGEVFVLCENDMTMVKRIVRERDGWLLTSDNSDKTAYRSGFFTL